MEQAEDGDAGDAEDEHQSALTEEPLAHPALGGAEGLVEAAAAFEGEEAEEEAVGVLALEHEVDAEEDGGDDVNEMSQPRGQGYYEIVRGRGDGTLGLRNDGVDADAVDHGDLLELDYDGRDALGEFGGEITHVAQHGRQTEAEEESECEEYGNDEDNDRDGAGGVVAADRGCGDGVDDGHQDDGEERADVEHGQDFAELPGEGEQEQNANGEEDVAADAGAGFICAFCVGGWAGLG